MKYSKLEIGKKYKDITCKHYDLICIGVNPNQAPINNGFNDFGLNAKFKRQYHSKNMQFANEIIDVIFTEEYNKNCKLTGEYTNNLIK